MVCKCGSKMKTIESGNIERNSFKHLKELIEPDNTYRIYACKNCNNKITTEEKRVELRTAKSMRNEIRGREMQKLIGEYGHKAIKVFEALFDVEDHTARYWFKKTMNKIREQRRK